MTGFCRRVHRVLPQRRRPTQVYRHFHHCRTDEGHLGGTAGRSSPAPTRMHNWRRPVPASRQIDGSDSERRGSQHAAERRTGPAQRDRPPAPCTTVESQIAPRGTDMYTAQQNPGLKERPACRWSEVCHAKHKGRDPRSSCIRTYLLVRYNATGSREPNPAALPLASPPSQATTPRALREWAPGCF